MKRKLSTKSELISLLVASVIIAVFGWYLSRDKSTINDIENKQSIVKPINKVNVEEDKPKLGKLIISKNKNSSKYIYTFDLQNSEEKLIYTDSDEKNKIIYILGIINNKLAVLEAENINEEIGQLVLISIDGSAKKEYYQKNVNKSSPPLLSTSENKIITTGYNQSEKDFGFILKISNLDGTNSRTIKTINQSPLNTIVSNDGKNIYYSLIGQKDTKLIKIDIEGNEIKTAQIDGIIINLLKTDKYLILSLAPFGNSTVNQSKVVLLGDELTPVENKIEDEQGAEIDLKIISDNLITYQNVNFESGIINENNQGNAKLLDLENFEIKNLTKVNKIIGYISE